MNIEQKASPAPAIPNGKRPLAVTLIAWLFIAAGSIGIAYHANEFRTVDADLVWTLAIRLLAIVGGVYALRGANWARWVLLGWITFHVVLSMFHSLPEFSVHALLCAVVAYVLFRPQSTVYFRSMI